MENQPREKPFTSWKEIAAYLGCDERTCLRWEKERGLPVHRAGGGRSKSLVFAYKSELDEWLGKRKGEKAVKFPPEGFKSRSILRNSQPLIWALRLLMLIGVLATLWLLIKPHGPNPSQPYDFKINRSAFIVTNQKGAELWRYDSGLEDLMNDAGYREHFGHRRMSDSNSPLFPRLKFDDINEDGRVEVLIIIRSQDDSSPSFLLCLDSKGKPLWSYSPGREMVFGQKHYSPDYALDGFDVLKMRGEKKVLIIARHKPSFPSYIATLDPQGKELGEYWNSGRISDYVLADIDDDGLPGLVLVGTNNEYGKGFLAVLDPDYVWGCSPQSGDYKCPDLKPGSEIWYLLFPRTEVDRLEFGEREVMSSVDILRNNLIMTVSQLGRIIYELKPNMEMYSVIVSDSYKEKYRKYQAEGRITPGRLDANALSEALAKSVVYFDGTRWTTTVTLNKVNYHLFLEREAQARQKLQR